MEDPQRVTHVPSAAMNAWYPVPEAQPPSGGDPLYQVLTLPAAIYVNLVTTSSAMCREELVENESKNETWLKLLFLPVFLSYPYQSLSCRSYRDQIASA
jgi:hypothetical protein